MKIGTFRRGGRTAVALVADERALPLEALAAQDPRTYGPLAQASDVSELWDPVRTSLLVSASAALNGASGAVAALTTDTASLEWLPPVIAPEKIICIGLNYRDHAVESGMKIPAEPVFFNKFNNALTGAAGPVVIPSNSSQVDYEAELAVVLRSRVKRVAVKDAMSCVAGYTILHDVSARDWQFRTGQWISGKTFDTFAPCGPWLVTPDEVPDPHNLSVKLKLNGNVMQDSNTSNLIFPIPDLISYLSHIFTLEPGDIISTGTPPGVGFARKPQVFLSPGDTVEISVSGIGVMKHRCVAE